MKRDNYFEGGAVPEEPKKEEPKANKDSKSDHCMAWWFVLSGLAFLLILVLIVVLTLNHE